MNPNDYPTLKDHIHLTDPTKTEVSLRKQVFDNFPRDLSDQKLEDLKNFYWRRSNFERQHSPLIVDFLSSEIDRRSQQRNSDLSLKVSYGSAIVAAISMFVSILSYFKGSH